MIVACAGCKTRFRLADDKVRSTGTKVRCSRCGATFVVGAPPPEALPALDEPSVHEMHTQVMPIPADVLAQMRETEEEDTTRVHDVPAAVLAELRREPASGWGIDPLPPPAAERHSFDSERTPTPAWADPGPSSFGDTFTDVTFGPGSQASEPWQPPPPPQASEPWHLPPPPPPPQRSVPLPAAPLVEDDPLAILGPAPALPPLGFGGATLDRFAIDPPAQQRSGSAGPPPLPPRPGSFAPSLPPPPVVQPVMPPAPAPELELATEGWQPLPPAPAESPMELGPVAAAPTFEPSVTGRQQDGGPRAPTLAPAPGGKSGQGAVAIGRTRAAEPPPEAPDGARRLLRLVSGVAVIVTALACFVVARNGGALRFDTQALVSAFGLGDTPVKGALVPEQLQMGRYPSAGGELFYVRGRIASQAEATLGPAVRVVAELLDGDRVVARGVGWAGGEPTPEQVHRLQAPEAWDALAATIGARAAGPIARGGHAPFFIVVGAAPADTSALRLRIVAEAAAAPSIDLPAVATDAG